MAERAVLAAPNPTTTRLGTKRRRSLAGLSVATVRVALIRESSPPYPEPITSAADVHRLLGPAAHQWDREHFVSVLLNGKSRVAGIDEISIGSLTAALVHPREVYKAALLANAASLILVHNHPSGDPTPSAEDTSLTRRLTAAGELLGIRVVDHVVIGDGRYYSFAEAGLL